MAGTREDQVNVTPIYTHLRIYQRKSTCLQSDRLEQAEPLSNYVYMRLNVGSGFYHATSHNKTDGCVTSWLV